MSGGQYVEYKLTLRNIPPTATESDVEAVVQTVPGGVVIHRVEILRDRETGLSRQLCRVSLRSPADAERAAAHLHGLLWECHPISARLLKDELAVGTKS